MNVKHFNSTSLGVFAVLVVLAGLVTILFRGLSDDIKGSRSMTEAFRRGRQLDHQLNENVLRSRAFILLNYDPLAEVAHEIVQLCNDIKNSGTGLREGGNLELSSLMNSYCGEAQKKLNAIERFKSKNSVLRNSLKYLPLLVSNIHGKERVQANEMYAALLRYNMEPSPEQFDTISKELNSLSASKLLSLGRHGMTVLHSVAERHAIEVEILSPAVEASIDRIQEEYAIQHEKFEAKASVYRILLIVLIGALSCILAWIFLRLEAAKALLSGLNSKLEETVALRTSELSHALAELNQKQQLLVQSSKMAALGEMAGGVAHEINNPLAILTLKIDHLEESATEGALDPLEILDTVGILRNTCVRIGKIVNGLRFFARDGKSLPTQPAALSEIIRDTLALCSERFSNHGVALTVSDKSFAGASVDCRPIEISQVLLNLLNNAYDAIQPIDQKWIRIELADRGESYELSVTDCGGGISSEIQDKILQPFFSTKEIGKGTGLGLSISKGIIEAHKGKLYLDRECTNTRFIVSLPKTLHASTMAA